MTYISLVIAVVVFTVLIVFFMKSKGGGRRKYDPTKVKTSGNDAPQQSGGLNTELVKSKWTEIQNMQNAGPSALKNALIEADKLLDYVMIQKGFRGETMGERLKSGGSAFSNLNAIWGAHKLRNQLAHEIEHDMVATQVKQAIADLGQGIKDLGVSL